MKKYLLSTLAAASLIGMASNAKAAEDDSWMGMNMSDGYAVMQAGMGFGRKDYKESAVFALGGGYHLNQYLKSDLTLGLRAWGKVKTEGHKADILAVPALMNMYITMPYKRIEPYIMGGLGASWNRADSTHFTKGDDKISFAWTAGAGIGYRLSHCWDLDLGYRYVDLGEARSKLKDGSGRIKRDVTSHDVLLSARYYF